MNMIKDYVNFKLTHADKDESKDGYPLLLDDCKKHKPMRDLKIYGNSYQNGTPTPDASVEIKNVGELVTDKKDINYGKYRIPVVIRGINLFNRKLWNAPKQTINGITFTPLDDERIHIKGVAEDTTKAISYQKLTYTTRRMMIKKGFYRVKPCKYSLDSGFTYMFGISNGTNAININSKYSGAEVTFGDAYINYVQFHLSGIALKKEYDDIIEIQLVSGTEDLLFEPYVEPINTNVFLDEPLCKIGDYIDYIDFKNKKVIKKNHMQKVLSSGIGTKNAYWFNAGWNAYSYSLSANPAYVTPNNVSEMCTHFRKPKSFNSNDAVEYGFSISSSGEILYFITTKASDESVSEFKTFLNQKEAEGNPVVVYYRLKKTADVPVNLDLPKIKAKTTIIEVDTSLAPSDAYAKYIKK